MTNRRIPPGRMSKGRSMVIQVHTTSNHKDNTMEERDKLKLDEHSQLVQLKLEKLIENSKKWYTKERMNYRNNPLPTPNSNPTPTLKVKPTPKEEFTTLEILTGIKVLEFNWYKNGAEVLVRGEIMNISDKKMSFVEVIVTFYDSNKNVVGVESGFMDKASIYPMETSEFNITGKFRDNYKTCSIKINP